MVLTWTRTNEDLVKQYEDDELGTTIYTQLQSIWRRAGISPTMAPLLKHLPTLSLIKVELSHMMYHHIIPLICSVIKNSFVNFNTHTISSLFEAAWPRLTRGKYRPSMYKRTFLKNCNEGTKVTLKTINVYNSAFELAVHGTIFGFDPRLLNVLERVITWGGVFFCDTVSLDIIDWLKTEVLNICILIESIPEMKAIFANKQCLYIWLNMVHYNLYYEDIPITNFGLMWEGKHQVGKKINRTVNTWNPDKHVINYATKNRLLKDLDYQALGVQIPNKLGYGLRQLILEDQRHKGLTTRLLQYQMQDNTIKLELNPKYSYKSGFIAIKTPYLIDTSDWKNYEECTRQSYPLTNKMRANKMSQIMNNIIVIVRSIFQYNHNRNELKSLYDSFVQSLRDGDITISRLIGFSTFYRNFMDSHFRCDNPQFVNLVWVRTPRLDTVMSLNLILLIEGISSCDYFQNKLKMNFTKNWNTVLVMIGNEFKPVQDNVSLNYEIYNISNTPVITDSFRRVCYSAEYAVQQVYGAHDHIKPSRNDMLALSSKIPQWPIVSAMHFPDIKSRVLPPYLHDPVGFCGLVWVCNNCNPGVVNCPICLTDPHASGTITAYCCQNRWKYIKCYTIYQGFLSRFANSDSINELSY